MRYMDDNYNWYIYNLRSKLLSSFKQAFLKSENGFMAYMQKLSYVSPIWFVPCTFSIFPLAAFYCSLFSILLVILVLWFEIISLKKLSIPKCICVINFKKTFLLLCGAIKFVHPMLNIFHFIVYLRLVLINAWIITIITVS